MTEVRLSGPMFDGRAPGIINAMLDEAKGDVAARGSSLVHQNLDRSIRHPTPYYETQILTERAGDDRVVHDRGVVYGPWLEGTGSRNRTTRFKGYFSFRRAAQRLDQEAATIANRAVHRHARRLNG